MLKAVFLSLLICATGTTAPPVISAVKAVPGTTTATISWSLDMGGTGQVLYGPTTKYGKLTPKEASFTYRQHVQTLTGLTPGATCYYRIRSEGLDGAVALSTPRQVTTKQVGAVTSISIDPEETVLPAKLASQFRATVTGTGSYDARVRWACTKGSILQSGLYTAPATPGDYTVTATSRQDPTKAATCKVKVLAKITSIEIDPRDTGPMGAGETRKVRLVVK